MSILVKFELLEIYPEIKDLIPEGEESDLRIIFSFDNHSIEESALMMLNNIESSLLKVSTESARKEVKINTKLMKGSQLLGSGDLLIPSNVIDKKEETMKKWLNISNSISNNKTDRKSQNLAMNLVNSIRLNIKAVLNYSEMNIAGAFSMSDVGSGKKTNHNSKNSFMSNNSMMIKNNNSNGGNTNFNEEYDAGILNNSVVESRPSISINNLTPVEVTSSAKKEKESSKNKENPNSVGTSRTSSVPKIRTQKEKEQDSKISHAKPINNNDQQYNTQTKEVKKPKNGLTQENKVKSRKSVSTTNINSKFSSAKKQQSKNLIKTGKEKTKPELKTTANTRTKKNIKEKNVNKDINVKIDKKPVTIIINEADNVASIINTEGDDEEFENINEMTNSFIDPVFIEEDNNLEETEKLISNKFETSLEEFRTYYTPEFFEVLPDDSTYLKFEAKMILDKFNEIQENYYSELKEILRKQNTFDYFYSVYGEKYRVVNKKLNKLKETLESFHMATTYSTFINRQRLLHVADSMSLANDELNFYKQVLNVGYQAKEVLEYVKQGNDSYQEDKKILILIAEKIFSNESVKDKLKDGQRALLSRILGKNFSREVDDNEGDNETIAKNEKLMDESMEKSGNISFNNLNVVYTNHNQDNSPSDLVTLSNIENADIIKNNVTPFSIDYLLRDAIKDYSTKKNLKTTNFEFKHISEGLYEYNQHKVIVFVDKDELKVNNSNVILPLFEFLENKKNGRKLTKEDTSKSTKSKKGNQITTSANSIRDPSNPSTPSNKRNFRNSLKK